MNPEFVEAWYAWLRSRPCGYSKKYLWEVKPGDRQGRDSRSPLAWVVDRFLEANPGRGRWVLPDPVRGVHNYTLEVDGERTTYFPPRAVMKWAGMDEVTMQAVNALVTKASSHANYADRLRQSDRARIRDRFTSEREPSLFD